MVTPANYDDLGILLWIVIGAGFIIPIVTIWMFNPDPDNKTLVAKRRRESEK